LSSIGFQQQARECNDKLRQKRQVTRIVEVTASNEATSKRLSQLTRYLSGGGRANASNDLSFNSTKEIKMLKSES